MLWGVGDEVAVFWGVGVGVVYIALEGVVDVGVQVEVAEWGVVAGGGGYAVADDVTEVHHGPAELETGWHGYYFVVYMVVVDVDGEV